MIIDKDVVINDIMSDIRKVFDKIPENDLAQLVTLHHNISNIGAIISRRGCAVTTTMYSRYITSISDVGNILDRFIEEGIIDDYEELMLNIYFCNHIKKGHTYE